MDRKKTGTSPPTVVIVDDDHRFVRQLSTFVERHCGLSITGTFSSAEEALERVGDLQPSFILLDVSMGGMSGLDAIGLLKAESASSDVILVTSMPEEYGERAVELGAAGYVQKGRIPEDLPELIAAAM